jgi:hypothetical protein
MARRDEATMRTYFFGFGDSRVVCRNLRRVRCFRRRDRSFRDDDGCGIVLSKVYDVASSKYVQVLIVVAWGKIA